MDPDIRASGFRAGRLVRRSVCSTLATLCLALLLTAVAAAAVERASFTVATNFPVGSTPHSVAAGDFNGDSFSDVAVANGGSNTVSIRLGAAGGSLTAPTNFPVGTDPFSVAVGDYNGDSDPDLAVANRGSNNVSVLLGDAGGSFTGATNYPVGSGPTSVAVGNFDGDSDPDLAVANGGSNTVSILLGATGGGFTAQTGFPAGSSPRSVAVGDFDGDSDPDLAVANIGSDVVSILLGGAGGSFAAPTSFPAGSGPASVAVGDFNSDSDPDLAVADAGNDGVSILLGSSGGSFTDPTLFATGSVPFSVAVGRFNGDSDPDLAIANGSSDTVSILVGAAGGSFEGPSNLPVGPNPEAAHNPSSVAVGDFNGDSRPDLAVANANSANISILLGGRFAVPVDYPVGGLPGSVAVDDFNGDSDPDLAMVAGGQVSVLLGDTGGGFTGPTNFPADSPWAVAVGDFNGDADPDLAVTNGDTGTVSILLGAAGGSFTGPTSFPAGFSPIGVAVGDFNSDSDPDLAVTQGGSDTVSILLGTAGGSFAAPTDFTVGGGPRSVAVGNFNGDSDPDLAVANFHSDNVSILLGEAGGTFSSPTNFPVGVGDSSPISIVVADFNGDSDPDLATANHGPSIDYGDPDTASILLGGAGGSFTGPTNLAVGDQPNSVAVGDFDGDLDLELAVTSGSPGTNPGNDTVAIFHGSGNGSFTGRNDYAVDVGPSSVAVGDFDGDLDRDLAVAVSLPSRVSILLNNTKTVAHPRPLAASPIQVSLVPAFQECTGASNRTHGPPLAYPSCAPPQQTSPNLTVRVPGGDNLFKGSVRLAVRLGPPGGVDDTDVRLQASISHVMHAFDFSEYTGELRTTALVRVTDKDEGVSSTIQDFPLSFDVPCVSTPDPNLRSTCSIVTGVDAVVPGASPEGTRAVWELDQVKVYDGGPDEDGATEADNSLFAVQGLFVP